MSAVCVIEDESSIREMIKMNLELEGFTVTTYEHGKEALDNAEEISKSDLVILDVMLPVVNGLEICSKIRSYSAVPVLFLSAKGTTADKIAGLKKGGNDYLSKPFDLEELLLRVQVLTHSHRADIPKSGNIESIGNKTINFETYEVKNEDNGEIVTLSKREIELLKLFIENDGRVISRDEILDRVWGKDIFPTSRTIDNYILSFRKLFEKDARHPLYFHSIRSVGYKFTKKVV